MKKIASIIFIIIFSFNVMSDECQTPVKALKKGEAADCDGYRFSPETEKEARQYKYDAEYYKQLSDSVIKLSDIKTDYIATLNARLDMTQHELDMTKSDTRTNTVLYIGIGVLVGGLGYALLKK